MGIAASPSSAGTGPERAYTLGECRAKYSVLTAQYPLSLKEGPLLQNAVSGSHVLVTGIETGLAAFMFISTSTYSLKLL